MDKLNIDDILTKHNTVIDNINSALEDNSPQIRTNSDQIIIALLARQLCGADSISVLSSRRYHTYIPAILRPMLEALADLVNIINDPEHIKVMTYSYSKQEISILEHIANNNYQIFNDNEPIDSASRLEKAKAYCEENSCLQENAKIYKKFFDAGLTEEYKTTYNMLCRSTHNNIDQLKQDHFPHGDSEFFTHACSSARVVATQLIISSDICLRGAKLAAQHFTIASPYLESAKDTNNLLVGTLSEIWKS